MKESEIYAVCAKHGELALDQVNRGGRLRSGTVQYRCKICQRADQKKYYEKNKLLKKHNNIFKDLIVSRIKG